MRKIVACLIVAVSTSFAVLACDTTPAIDTNPVTGNQERVCSIWDGHDFEVYWYEKVNGSWSAGTQLTDNAQDDVAARLSIDGGGATGVVWRESGSVGQIHYLGRKDVSGTYTWQANAIQVSDGLNDASAPAILLFGDQIHVGWHESTPSGTEIQIGYEDNSDPWPSTFDRASLGTPSNTGNLQLELKFEDDHLWVVWVDSLTDLAYAEWDSSNEDWGVVSDEGYSGPSDVIPARTRVRDVIVD